MPKSKKGALDGVAEQLLDSLKTKLLATEEQLLTIDFESLLREAIKDNLAEMVKEMAFPNKSIPAASINYIGGSIPGNAIRGGPIHDFTSTGIEDLAKETQLTVMNKMVVVENQLVSHSADIKKNATIGGKLTIKSDTPFDNATTNRITQSVAGKVFEEITARLDKKFTEISEENISGDRVGGGTITNFSSTGIEDRAGKVQLTILDKATVFENKLVAAELEVKGNTVINGNLTINGEFPLDDKTKSFLVDETSKHVYENMSETLKEELLAKFKKDGLDSNNIKVNNRNIFEGKELNELSPHIRKSRLTELGHLKQLLVQGEAQLSGSLYTSHSRVGVNTVDPSAALSVWDSEIEILFGKLRDHTSFIGSQRRQKVTLGAGNQENIVLNFNGETTIENLIADQTRIASTEKEPKVKGEPGDIVFNIKPKLGEPWGWMCCVGGAWAEMGKLK